MINVAVTGGIGSGKSSVIEQMKLFRPFSNYYSVDSFVKELYEDADWLYFIYDTFGVKTKDEMSKLVFSHPAIQKMVMVESQKFISGRIKSALLSKSQDGINIVEFPLLFEYKKQKDFDLTILITADLDTRVKRAIQRDGKTEEDILKIINSQMAEHHKKLRANVIIETDINTPNQAARAATCAITKFLKDSYEQNGNCSR